MKKLTFIFFAALILSSTVKGQTDGIANKDNSNISSNSCRVIVFDINKFIAFISLSFKILLLELIVEVERLELPTHKLDIIS